ncbi:MAG: DNA repair protein RecO [Oscillospiraceae bacterium]|nr:DNA repair protein RecO [Oscillospiraceae bacterium]
MHMTTQGLVLREVNYKEADKILTVLTRDGGKQTVSARGCRRKNSTLAASAQLLVYSDMTLYEHQGRWSLKEAVSNRQFWGVRGEIEKLALASYFAELTELVTEEDIPALDILSLVLNSLHALDQLPKDPALVKAAFELKLMALAGYEPLLDACAVCGRETPQEPRLSLLHGVLHCAGCRECVGGDISLPLPPEVLSAMRYIIYGDPKRLFSFRLTPEGLMELGGVCEAFLLTQMERGFRTLDFYKRLTIGTDR